MTTDKMPPFIIFCWLCLTGLPLAAADSVGEWPLYGREYNNQRFSPLKQIDSNNVKHLQRAWRYQTGRKGTFQTSPIVIGRVMYLTTPFNDVIALDAATGELIWRYHHKLRKRKFCCGPANRGPALADGKVYTVTIDARLICLDQNSGKVLWDIELTGANTTAGESLDALPGIEELRGATQTGQTGYTANLAPQVYGGMVFAGITGAGYGLHLELNEDGEPRLSVGGLSGSHGLRGFLAAYDGESGREIWRWYSVPESGWEGAWQAKTAYGKTLNRDLAAEKAAFKKYAGTWRYGGGSIWTTPAIDPQLGLIYLGTGNPSPQMDDSTRPGDNLYTVSLVALDLHNGKLKWHYQQVPHDRWGYDVASPPLLFDYTHQGKTVKAVGQASKLGWFFIHNRETGELLKLTEPFIPQENLFAPPSAEGVRIVPGTLGASSWSPVSFHPYLRNVYIAAIYQPSLFYTRKLSPRPGEPWERYTFFKKSEEEDFGFLTAINIDSGKVVWREKTVDPLVGGSLATAGDLVFSGAGSGYFRAYDARTGKKLWEYKSEYGVNAPPISYAVDGRQYIAVAAGGNRLFGYPTGDEILVFRLHP